MSEDLKTVGTQFAKDYLTSIQNQATADDDDTGDGASDITKYDDPSLQSQVALMDIQNTQQQLNMETAAELDRIQREFYTTQDIRKGQAEGVENRLSQMVGGEQQRLSARVAGEEQRRGMAESGTQQRLGIAETGSQQRQSARVAGQESRAGMAEQGSQQRQSTRVSGQEQRAGMAESGTQERMTRRVEGQEVRETDLQREMFRRYKEARDYGQAQSAYRA